MTETEKKQALFLRQKELLDTFLSTGAISRAQYETSLRGLKEKMGLDCPAEDGGTTDG